MFMVEARFHNEMGWNVFMQQGNHRHNRPKEEATWEALSIWADLGPILNHVKEHEEILFFPEELRHEPEQTWDCLSNLAKIPSFSKLSDIRRKAMKGFCLRFRKFAIPATSEPAGEARPRLQSYARAAAISKLWPVQDSLDYLQRITSSPTPSPPTDLRKGTVWQGARAHLSIGNVQRLKGASLQHFATNGQICPEETIRRSISWHGQSQSDTT
jgi:hypothetical protein